MRDVSHWVRMGNCVPCSSVSHWHQRVLSGISLATARNLCTPLGSTALYKECWVGVLSVGLKHCLCPCLNLVMVLSESSTFWKCTACCIKKVTLLESKYKSNFSEYTYLPLLWHFCINISFCASDFVNLFHRIILSLHLQIKKLFQLEVLSTFLRSLPLWVFFVLFVCSLPTIWKEIQDTKCFRPSLGQLLWISAMGATTLWTGSCTAWMEQRSSLTLQPLLARSGKYKLIYATVPFLG